MLIEFYVLAPVAKYILAGMYNGTSGKNIDMR
jgi:hypothetical protein